MSIDSNPFVGRATHWRGVGMAAGVVVLFAAAARRTPSRSAFPARATVRRPACRAPSSLAERTQPGGFQGHWCGARKVAQHNLFDRGSFGDLQLKGDCVYASMRDPSNLNALTTGTAVLDARVPANLVVTPDTANPPNPNGKILRTRGDDPGLLGARAAGQPPGRRVQGLRAHRQRRRDQPARRLRRVGLPEPGAAVDHVRHRRRQPRRLAHARRQDLLRHPVRRRARSLRPGERADPQPGAHRHARDRPVGPAQSEAPDDVEPALAAARGARAQHARARGDQLPRRQHQRGRHARLHGALRRQQLARRQQQQPDPGAEPALLERAAHPRLERRRQPRRQPEAEVHQLPVVVRPADRPRFRRRLDRLVARDRVRAPRERQGVHRQHRRVGRRPRGQRRRHVRAAHLRPHDRHLRRAQSEGGRHLQARREQARRTAPPTSPTTPTAA